MNGGPELTSLIREKVKDGWPEKKIRRWLTEEHQLYTKEQVDKVFKVINAERVGENKEAKNRRGITGLARLRRNTALIIFFALLGIVLFAISPFPGIVSSYLFGKHPGSCGFLEEKYCLSSLTSTGPDGQKYTAFNVPAGTLVFAPFTGLFEYKGEDYQSTSTYTVGYMVPAAGRSTAFEFFANFQPIASNGSLIRKGEPVAILRGGAVNQIINSDFLVKD